MSRKYVALVASGTTALLCSLIGPAFLLDSSQYQALAAGVQAFGVVAALAAAAATFAREAQDRRVDRASDMYQTYQGGVNFDARRRMREHIRASNGTTVPVLQAQLHSDVSMGTYATGGAFSPKDDVEKVLRYFESLNGMRCAQVLDVHLAHRLIGRHVLWWDYAILYDSSAHLRQPLRDLAEWVRIYNQANQPPYLDEWQRNLAREFGCTANSAIYTTPSLSAP